MAINSDHIIGGFWVALIFILIGLVRLCWAALLKLSYEEPADRQSWKVGDFKVLLERLPNDMPVILLDVSTDDVDFCNYHFTNEDIVIDDYYHLDSDDHNDGIPAGKALFLHFDNCLNENPINLNYEQSE